MPLIADGSHVCMSSPLAEPPSQTSNGHHAASTQISNNVQAKNSRNRTFHLCGSDFFPPVLFISVSGNLYPQLMKLKIKKSCVHSSFFAPWLKYKTNPKFVSLYCHHGCYYSTLSFWIFLVYFCNNYLFYKNLNLIMTVPYFGHWRLFISRIKFLRGPEGLQVLPLTSPGSSCPCSLCQSLAILAFFASSSGPLLFPWLDGGLLNI